MSWQRPPWYPPGVVDGIEFWPEGPAALAAAPGAVDIWRFALNLDPAALARAAAWLSPDERERAARFKIDRVARAFVAARAGLRAVLARYTGAAPEAIRFSRGPHGKPRLADAAEPRFNLAHSGGLALVAVTAGREVGVDVEAVRPLEDAAGIAARFFSPAERARYAAAPPGAREAAFFEIWTRKEAWLKASETGLSRSLSAIDLDDEAARFRIRSFVPASGYAAAVATEGAAPAPLAFYGLGATS